MKGLRNGVSCKKERDFTRSEDAQPTMTRPPPTIMPLLSTQARRQARKALVAIKCCEEATTILSWAILQAHVSVLQEEVFAFLLSLLSPITFTRLQKSLTLIFRTGPSSGGS